MAEYDRETLLLMLVDENRARLTACMQNNKTAFDRAAGVYDVPPQQLIRLLIDQDFRCPICRISLEVSRWVIEHDHRTGRVRGLTCYKCNTWLGLYEDQIESAWRYLKGPP